MKRSIIGLVVVAAVGAGAAAYYMRDGEAVEGAAANRPGGNNGRGGGGGMGGPGGGFGGPGGFGGFGGGPRMPMTVELSTVKRGDVSMQIQVVGNLIGAATVAAAPKVSGRLDSVAVRLGDRVTEGQPIAKIEDRELQEQLKQAEASHAVAEATIRQRAADLKLAEVNRDRNNNLYERQLISRQTYDDTEARYQAAEAQVDLAQAQLLAAKSRLDELKINMANTTITSPVNGFVASRALDPGAWVTPNTAFLSLVDISRVRLIANIIEKDLRRIHLGLESQVEVDAYPGEKFTGRVAHMAPILDPATRTAQIEIEIPNSGFRLKPGMYAKVNFTVDKRENTLVVPASAVIDLGGKRGVFVPAEGNLATFRAIEQGVTTTELVEVAAGLTEGEKIITTGSGALREGDRIVLPGESPQNAGSGRGGRGGGRRGGSPGSGQGDGQRGGAPGGAAPQPQAPREGAPIRPSTGD
jgi:membrane fusion protein, multidrug efflux system